MKHKIYRQFTEMLWENPQTYQNLSDYLSEHGIKNTIEHSAANKQIVKGQIDNLIIKVTFGPISAGKINSHMKALVRTGKRDQETQKRTAEILTLLAQYMPSYLK